MNPELGRIFYHVRPSCKIGVRCGPGDASGNIPSRALFERFCPSYSKSGVGPWAKWLRLNVRFGSKRDISRCNRHVCFAPKADIGHLKIIKRNVDRGSGVLASRRNTERNDDPSDFRRCRGPRIASAGHSPGSGPGGPLVCGDERRRPLGLPLLVRRRMSAERSHGQSWLVQSEPVLRCGGHEASP